MPSGKYGGIGSDSPRRCELAQRYFEAVDHMVFVHKHDIFGSVDGAADQQILRRVDND